MSETKSVVRYDNNYLQKYCKENGIELLKDYSKEKVNRDTIIEAKSTWTAQKKKDCIFLKQQALKDMLDMNTKYGYITQKGKK